MNYSEIWRKLCVPLVYCILKGGLVSHSVCQKKTEIPFFIITRTKPFVKVMTSQLSLPFTMKQHTVQKYNINSNDSGSINGKNISFISNNYIGFVNLPLHYSVMWRKWSILFFYCTLERRLEDSDICQKKTKIPSYFFARKNPLFDEHKRKKNLLLHFQFEFCFYHLLLGQSYKSLSPSSD